MHQSKYLILGGGMVAGFAAQEMAEHGLEAGALTILSADEAPPYHRPPLSKGFLAGEEDADEILINEEDFYTDHGIDLRLGDRVEAVDLAGRTVRTAGGEELGFERLLIATGARPRRLEVPGANLPGIHLLRALDDSRRIRERLAEGRRAVVIGGGFIGTEVAAVLADDGLEVTLVYREDRLLEHLFTPDLSRHYESVFRENGVTLRPGAVVARMVGDERVESVELASGDRLEASLVVAGIGVEPATDLFRGTGVELDDGVVVDERLATAVEGVWAAGDVARYRDVVFGGHRRVEHWDNAVEQGKLAGRNLLAAPGKGEVFDHVPYFFSDVFDLSWELWGDPSGADEVAVRGGMEDGSFSVWWLRERRPVAAFVLDRPDEEREAAEALIRAGRPIAAEALRDTGRQLRKAS